MAHKGKRAFLVGNGPSINRQDLNRMRDDVVFACNSFYLKYGDLTFRPTYHAVEDRLVAEDNSEELSALDCSTKLTSFDLRKFIRPDQRTVYFNFVRHYMADSNPRFPRFSFDAGDKVYWGGTVLYMCIQLAAFMGCDPIYLIGVDLSYNVPKTVIADGSKLTSTEDDVNHFHPAYFGKGKRWHVPHPERMGRCFERAAEILGKKGVRLINATDGGNLNAIPRVAYETLFTKAAK